MALQHLRSSTADKRPTPAAMSDGQLAMNTNLASPGLFLKDSNGDLVKVGPVHVGTTAPNATPASGGSSGNSKGEQWLDISVSPPTPKAWDGSAFVGSYTFESGTTILNPLLVDATLSGTTVIDSGSTVQDALLVDAIMSGTTFAPTATSGDSSNAIATTEFVSDAIAAIPAPAEGISLALVVALA